MNDEKKNLPLRRPGASNRLAPQSQERESAQARADRAWKVRVLRPAQARDGHTMRFLSGGPQRLGAGSPKRALEAFFRRITDSGHIVISFTCMHCGEKQHQIVKADRKPVCIGCRVEGP